MQTSTLARRLRTSDWFVDTPLPYLVVDEDLRILEVNAAYERATDHRREALMGRVVIDVFPDNPNDPTADGVINLSQSLDTVFRSKRRHWMGVQRYDLPAPADPDRFVPRSWAPVNSPLGDGDRVAAVLHHVEDVTAVALGPRAQDGAAPARTLATVTELAERFPEVTHAAVAGLVARSQQVVTATLGRCDPDRVLELATLRLEILAGRPVGAGMIDG